MAANSSVFSALVVLVVATAPGFAAKLPTYVKACPRSDQTKLNQCILENAKQLMPHIINGDSKYHVPKLNPLVIPKLALTQGDGKGAVGLNLAWTNAELHGLKDFVLQDVNMDLKTHHINLTLFFPLVSITGTYDASGRILVLPIVGTGPSNITLSDVLLTVELDWPYVKRNGKQYIDVKNSKGTLYKVGLMRARLENLFNGDKLLGENMNTFINENWRDVVKEFGPGIVDALANVFELVLKNIISLVPVEHVFKD